MTELTRLKIYRSGNGCGQPAPNSYPSAWDPGAPAGASISAAGLFKWRPTELQGPGVYPITVRVTDNGTPKFERDPDLYRDRE